MHSIYPWQNTEWKQLIDRKNNAQLPHAILIKGVEGVGKYNFALSFAELLLCPSSKNNPCGICANCKLLESNNHPDLILIKAEEKSKSIKIDQIRETISDLNNTSQQGGHKVVIIDQAELMNIAASNALLKTLEEPAPNIVMILIANQPEALTATIRSRCQIISIKTPVFAEAKEWVEQQTTKSIDLKLALALAENAPLRALNILQEDHLNKRRDFFKHLYELRNKKLSIVHVAEEYWDWDFKTIVLMFMQVVNDLIKIKLNAFESVTNQDQLENLTKFANKASLSKLFDFYKHLLKLHQHLLKNINLNQQLALEDILITWE